MSAEGRILQNVCLPWAPTYMSAVERTMSAVERTFLCLPRDAKCMSAGGRKMQVSGEGRNLHKRAVCRKEHCRLM